MAYARAKAKKHYRVVQKKIAQAPSKGIFISNCKKNKCLLFGAAALIFVFIKGVLLGYLLGKND